MTTQLTRASHFELGVLSNDRVFQTSTRAFNLRSRFASVVQMHLE